MMLLCALLLTGCAAGQQTQAYRRIDMDSAISMMETEQDYVILDVRTQAEYEAGHIPGAICIPNETIAKERPDELPQTDQLILVYCRSGNRSKQASQKLAVMGYTQVVEFGGIRDWPGDVRTGAAP